MKPQHAIVAGGGWKHPKNYRIKAKCLWSSVFAFVSLIVSVHFFEETGKWVFAVPGILLIAALLFAWREHPVICHGLPDGDEDPRNLYGCGNRTVHPDSKMDSDTTIIKRQP